MKCTERNLITCAWTFYHSVIWSHVFLSLTWNLCQVHPAQWWSKIVLTFDCCCPHSIEVTSELVVLKGFWGQWHTTNLPGCYGILLAVPSDTLCHAVLTRWWEKSFQKRIKITMDLKMMIDSYSWYNQQKATKGNKSHDQQVVMPITHFNDSDNFKALGIQYLTQGGKANVFPCK